MAVLTGSSTAALFNTAGLSVAKYGLDILLDLPNLSVFMGQGQPSSLMKAYSVANGYTLHAPVMSGRSATARTAGTDDNNTITFSALSGTAVTFTPNFSYDAWAIDYQTMNKMTTQELAASLIAAREQSTLALKNVVDAAMLGLYSSATYDVGGAGADVTIGMLAEAKRRLEVANAPKPYYCVLPATQDDVLSQMDELNRVDIRGDNGTILNGDKYRWHGIDIYVTGNCPTASSITHGLMFSAQALKAVFRDLPTIKAWDQENQFSYQMAVYMDWAYAVSFADWIVDINVQEVS